MIDEAKRLVLSCGARDGDSLVLEAGGEAIRPLSQFVGRRHVVLCSSELALEVRWTCIGLLALLLLLPIAVGCADSGDSDDVRNLRPPTNQIVVFSPEGGGYHAFSQLLAHDLTTRLGGEYSVRLVTSTRDGDVISGSMDVLDAMARNTEGQVHYLGLSQSDVAYHFRYGGHPIYEVPHPHRERLSALAARGGIIAVAAPQA
jgi:hypothetical protein